MSDGLLPEYRSSSLSLSLSLLNEFNYMNITTKFFRSYSHFYTSSKVFIWSFCLESKSEWDLVRPDIWPLNATAAKSKKILSSNNIIPRHHCVIFILWNQPCKYRLLIWLLIRNNKKKERRIKVRYKVIKKTTTTIVDEQIWNYLIVVILFQIATEEEEEEKTINIELFD